MPSKGQDTQVDYSTGWHDGSVLKSGAPRKRQPARPSNRRTPAIGIPSNVGPQRDYSNALSSSSTERIPTRGEERAKMAREYGYKHTPAPDDGELDFYAHRAKYRSKERD